MFVDFPQLPTPSNSLATPGWAAKVRAGLGNLIAERIVSMGTIGFGGSGLTSVTNNGPVSVRHFSRDGPSMYSIEKYGPRSCPVTLEMSHIPFIRSVTF